MRCDWHVVRHQLAHRARRRQNMSRVDVEVVTALYSSVWCAGRHLPGRRGIKLGKGLVEHDGAAVLF